MTYGKLLKKLSELNPLELEEDVVVMNESTKAIHALTGVRVATNYLIIGEVERLAYSAHIYNFRTQKKERRDL